MMTGDDRYLEGAEKGTDTCATICASMHPDEKVFTGYHGIAVQGQRETKVFASEFAMTSTPFRPMSKYMRSRALFKPIVLLATHASYKMPS